MARNSYTGADKHPLEKRQQPVPQRDPVYTQPVITTRMPEEERPLGTKGLDVDAVIEASIKLAAIEAVPEEKPTSPKALIVMPTMRRRGILLQTLQALLDHTDREWVDLYVVVNGDEDGSSEVVTDLLNGEQNCHMIVNEQNIGYAQAISQAFAFRREGQHTIHMDDDVLLTQSRVVQRMVRMVETDHSIGLLNPYGFNTGEWRGIQRPVGDGVFGDMGYIWTTFAMIAEQVHASFGACWQPGLYGFEDYITSKRVQRLGYRVGYYIPTEPVYENLGMDQLADIEYEEFKREQRRQTERTETDRAKAIEKDKEFKELTDVWEHGKGPGGDLFHPLPEKDSIPLIF